MSALQTALGEYLAVRRSLGFKLRYEALPLLDFVRSVEQSGASFITADLALQWATQPRDCQPANWARRLSMIRPFARYCAGLDSRTQILPVGLLPHRFHRKRPYIYSDEEVSQLMQAARELPSRTGLRAATYSTLFGLLAVTGMRVGEAVGLDREDVDLQQGVLTIRLGKFGKSRLVPIHTSTRDALETYARIRDYTCPHPTSHSFFIFESGDRITNRGVDYMFVRLSRRIGLRGPTDSRGPRLHDLRHTFAVRTLLGWHQAGVELERYLPRLSTYLGHANVTDTYWYLTGTPELLRLAALRLESPKEHNSHENQQQFPGIA
ncbi:tyrosine-type recombinase/integrase [bacterium]|nr:tyrosine-type recombinase/integrase [bacterium]